MWPSFVKAAHDVMESNRGQPGYDIYGNKIRIQAVKTLPNKQYPNFDSDFRVNKDAMALSQRSRSNLLTLAGETILHETWRDGVYLVQTTSGNYAKIRYSESGGGCRFSASMNWDDLIALDIIPEEIQLRCRIEELSISVWDYNEDHPEIVKLVHQLRCNDQLPLPYSMRGVAKKYGLIGMW